jgi:Tfp pilus assembly protein PilX
MAMDSRVDVGMGDGMNFELKKTNGEVGVGHDCIGCDELCSVERNESDKRDKQDGFILVTTLIFLLILTLLAVGALEMGVVQLKINQNTFSNAENFQAAESALRVAEKMIEGGGISSARCFDQNVRGINEIASQSMAWWRSNACSQSFKGSGNGNNRKNSSKLYYWVEEVSRLTCGELENRTEDKGLSYNKILDKSVDKQLLENNLEDEKIKAENIKKIVIVYYRITGRGGDGASVSASDKEDSDSGNLILQSTYAKAVVDAPCVLQIPQNSLGRQSWREVEGL